MSQLTPCPECQRHVRKTEARCPFCDSALSLADVPSPVLPRRRMSRAATFAFGASVVGATALVACSDDEPGGNVAVYGAPPAAGAGGDTSFAGSAVYGAPPSGAPSVGGNGGTAPTDGGAAAALYGGAPAGGASGEQAGGAAGENGEGGGAFAVYGAPGSFGGSD